jgi:putative endopeptidase
VSRPEALRPGVAVQDRRNYPRVSAARAGVACLALCLGILAPSARAASTGSAAEGIFAGRDSKVAPGEDFFLHANGGWLRETEIPPDRSEYGIGEQLQDLTDQRCVQLIREAGEDAAAGSDVRRLSDYFTSYMDADTIESRGLAPLRPTLDAIDAIADRHALARMLGSTVRADVDALNYTHTATPNIMGLWVAQDLDDPTRYAPILLQGGLGMPDRDYYLNPNPRMTEMRHQYLAHIATMLQLAGDDESTAQARAARVVALESRIAQAHVNLADTEDVRKGNNHWSRAQFETLAPGMDWSAFLGAFGVDAQATFVVWQPQALKGIAALVGSEPLDAWKDFLRYHAIDDVAEVLPRSWSDEHFRFHERVVEGVPGTGARWKRALDSTNLALGEALGRLYVERYFTAGERARAQKMVSAIIAAFAKRIDRLDWMGAQTKHMAKAKLASLKVSVGYPDKWRDYSGLRIVAGDALGNLQRARRFELQRNLNKLGAPVDRGEWVMNPQFVDAVNLPVMNTIQIPAAILQPPYFSIENTAAVDYGETGTTIGHELSHAFDDQGALFDATGKLNNWWTPEDYARFTALGDALVKQFDAYHPLAEQHVRGRQTLGENIADLAGLAVAYDAWRAQQSGATPLVEGLNGDQQYFMSYAQGWRRKSRPEVLLERLLSDGHAPAQFRADTVRNLDAWYEAFSVEPGQALFLAPADRVRIW